MSMPGPDSSMPHRRHHRMKYFILAAAIVLALQILCLEIRTPAVTPEFFNKRAMELKVTRNWRYGFVQLWHGAVLLKTRNHEPQTVPAAQTFPEGPGWEVAAVMRRELEALPVKAALEACLYISLLAYVFFGWGRLKEALLAKAGSRGRLLLAHVLGWTTLWLIAGLPLLVWGYGTPLFTNCVGPGALSSSGLYLGRAPAYSSTVSYYFLLAVLAPVFLMLLAPISFALTWLPGLTEGQVLWLGGLLFFLSIGLVGALPRDRFGQGD
jgi:hypothetical protein